jgi:hypothetical protein
MHQYRVQVLSHFDAYTGKVLRRWFTKEYRRVIASSEDDAITLVYCGPFDSIGSVNRVY